jgi:3-dehydroquinate synthetase
MVVAGANTPKEKNVEEDKNYNVFPAILSVDIDVEFDYASRDMYSAVERSNVKRSAVIVTCGGGRIRDLEFPLR